MKKEEIDVLKFYLSEDEIKNIVIEEYRSVIREEIKNIEPSKRMSNHDRVISNAVYYMLENECDKILGCNTKELIEGHVKKILSKGEYSHAIFRTKNAWDSEDGIGAKLLKECVIDNKGLINDRVQSIINDMDIKSIHESLIECLIKLVDNKLKA
jgi:hypothetical protein